MLALTVVISVLAGLAFRRRFFGSTFVFYLAVASLIMPGLLVGLGVGLTYQTLGLDPELVQLGARRAAHLDLAVRAADHVRGAEPLQSRLRGGGARPGREQLADFLDGGGADPVSGHDRGGAVRLHAVLRRISRGRCSPRARRTRCRWRSGA